MSCEITPRSKEYKSLVKSGKFHCQLCCSTLPIESKYRDRAMCVPCAKIWESDRKTHSPKHYETVALYKRGKFKCSLCLKIWDLIYKHKHQGCCLDCEKLNKKLRKAKRRARERNAEGSFTLEQLKARFDYFGNRCIYCKTELDMTIEHLIPLARNGTNWASNLAPSCKKCNNSKLAKTHSEFLVHLQKKINNMKKLILVLCMMVFAASCGDRTQGIPSEKRYINGVELNCPKDIMHPATSIECRAASVSNRSTVSPNGVKIWIEDGATVTTESIQAIERGMMRAIAKSVCTGYGRDGWRALRLDDYVAVVLRATETDSQGNPAYRQPCGSYCGSEYDKGGFILVGGQMVASGNPYGNIFATPESRGRYDFTANGAEYELEHIILSWYDGNLFLATLYHGNGTGHPIYGCATPKDNLLFLEPTEPQVSARGYEQTPVK